MNTKRNCQFFGLILKLTVLLSIFLLFISPKGAAAQSGIDETKNTNPSGNRSRGLRMLKDIKELVKSNYYDPKFHGMDLDKRFNEAAEKIKTLSANWEIYREIANILLEFNDSHTRFIPPFRTHYVEYGFRMQMIGNECFVVSVKKGSDAESKLRAGDQILKIGSYPPARENLWMLDYLIYTLDPQPNLTLTVQGLDGKQRVVNVESKLITFEENRKRRDKRRAEQRRSAYKCAEIDSDLIACKLSTFMVDKEAISEMMKEVGQRKNLILDLRGNPGGYIKTQLHLTGYFFDRDVKIGDERRRNKTRERIAKSIKDKVYKGNVVVLIDSESASAAEVFARVVQIEKRGKIIGDQSAGAVMASNFFGMADVRQVADLSVREKAGSFYAVNLTVGDLVMTDGSRLEGIGVIPDSRIGPTAIAIAQKNDPVLVYAASLFGAKLSNEQAGNFKFLTESADDEENAEEIIEEEEN